MTPDLRLATRRDGCDSLLCFCRRRRRLLPERRSASRLQTAGLSHPNRSSSVSEPVRPTPVPTEPAGRRWSGGRGSHKLGRADRFDTVPSDPPSGIHSASSPAAGAESAHRQQTVVDFVSRVQLSPFDHRIWHHVIDAFIRQVASCIRLGSAFLSLVWLHWPTCNVARMPPSFVWASLHS